MGLELRGDGRSEDGILGISRAQLMLRASRLRPPWELDRKKGPGCAQGCPNINWSKRRGIQPRSL